MRGGKVWALDKGRAVSYNAALITLRKDVCLYSNGHIDINHLSPEKEPVGTWFCKACFNWFTCLYSIFAHSFSFCDY